MTISLMPIERPNAGRVVLTGARGRLGTVLRPVLAGYAGELVSSDILGLPGTLPRERFRPCDLTSLEAVQELFAGADCVVHFGGISNQRPFAELLHGNFLTVRNVFEAARRTGVRRVVFASSNHAVGFHPVKVSLDARAAYRPDSFYGASKAFGELTGRLFHDRYGIEVVCLRIGTCLERPTKPRHLSTWLSHGDLGRLTLASIEAENIGFEILYGVSNNSRAWWTNPKGPVDYIPQDSADFYADDIEDAEVDGLQFQGGDACFRESPED